MDDLYRENIIDHYKYPRNFGTLVSENASASDTVVSCGDSLTMHLRIEESCLTDIRFSGQGCAISMSAASMLTEIIKGKKIPDLQKLGSDDIFNLLGVELTPTRTRCALLSLEVLHKALHTYGKI